MKTQQVNSPTMNNDRVSTVVKNRRPKVKNGLSIESDSQILLQQQPKQQSPKLQQQQQQQQINKLQQQQSHHLQSQKSQKKPSPLLRSNTMPGKINNNNNFNSINNYNVKANNRHSTIGLTDREKSKSDDGFHHSDSDKDSNHSSHSNMSSSSTTNISSHPLSRNSSVKSDTVARVRPKSSLGMLTEKTKSDSLNLATVAANKQLKADRQAEEARKNRKIADLEISIKSLMKINSELDATNKKQAIEIQDLARRLQINDSFLCYEDENGSVDENQVTTPISEVNSEENRKESDIRFRKICLVIDTLIRDGKNALEYKSKIGGSRVLTNVQLDLEKLDESQNQNHSDDKRHDDDNDDDDKFKDKQLTQSSEYAVYLNNIDSKTKERDNSSSNNDDNNDSIKENSKIKIDNKSQDGNSSLITNSEVCVVDNSNSNKIELNNKNKNKNNNNLNLNLNLNLNDKERRIRIHSIINQLLSLARWGEGNNNNNNNNNNFFSASPSSIPTTPKTPEPKGLGLLLSDPTPHIPHIPNFTYTSSNGNNNNNNDIPSSYTTIFLLHELQELLGFNDNININNNNNNNNNNNKKSSHHPPNYTHIYRKSMPIITTNNNNNNNILLESTHNNDKDDAKISRRRSSPNFRSSSSSSFIISDRMLDATNSSISTITTSDVLKPPSIWSSSLGFLAPWKHD